MKHFSSDRVPIVDLVVVIDTSPSMKDEARALSRAAETAVNGAKSSCPCDLRVTWLGIEGTWKGTKFEQTVRGYLTEVCQISESNFSSRKRGELKSAGAQEDGARAIADLTDYYNWREGAAKAVFYLGDEALEGGGSKTERADIESANLAIQKAQAAGVTIHTYFGTSTSKSKHRQSIASEYARLSSETGGQAFTDRDSIEGFNTVLEKVICGSRTMKTDDANIQSATVYIQDFVAGKASNLYTLNLQTGKADSIGSIAADIYDLAFVGSQLYGLQQGSKTTNLVKIDRATGKATVVGDIGFNVVGLAYNHQRETLYATAAKQLIAIDPETGKGKPAVTVSKDKRGCGEVAFDAEGKTYITLIGTDKKKVLASCDLDSGKVKVIGDIGFPDLASMEFVGDVLYGVTGNFFNLGHDGQLIRIDLQTGKGTVVTRTTPLGRWAGMTVGEPATVARAKKTPAIESNKQPQTTLEEAMQLLTIDTKNNCYVIDPNDMNELQQNVASSFTFDRGTYDIQITSGRYSFAKSETEGEPLVLLWLYGENGSTFINKNTGFEVGATWTTLHGYNDRLQLEVKDKAVLCALFFDVNNHNNRGSVDLSITSQTPSFPSQRITVDSKKNSYVLDEKHLSSLKQWGHNFVELDSGNYRIKIREGNASYWSDNKQFDIEPWALIWIKAGKFVPKLTRTEVDETWCSLNGFHDEFILEVKQKTTLSGFFFDTYKEDNQGQIVLAIEPISAAEVAQAYERQHSVSSSRQQVTATSTVSATEQMAENKAAVGASSTSTSHHTSSTSYSGGSSFSFHFDEAQMEEMWQQMVPKIEASVRVTDEQDEKKEARYWDNLEKWILKGYQSQAKELAMQVARLEFMMKTITQQMEVSFNQNFQAWSSHFDNRLNNLLASRITTMVDERVNRQLSQHTQEIKKLVVEQMQSDLDKRIDTVVNLKVGNLSQDIKKTSLEQIEADLDKRIAKTVNVNIDDRSTEINNAIVEQIHNQMDERINSVVNLKISDRSQEIKKSALKEIQADLDKRINAVVDLKITDLTPELNNSVVQQIQGNMDKRIDAVVNLKTNDLPQNIKNLVIQQIKPDLDRQITSVVNKSTENNVSVVANNIMGDIDDRINVNFDNKMLNFRDDVTAIVKNEINHNNESLSTTILDDLTNRQFFLDMQTIKAEVDNFYARLGQFETQLYSRIEQGDTHVYNWTLEQLTALQGCMSDRQTLSDLFESFASQLKDELDNAACVQPSRFRPMTATVDRSQIAPAQSQQLPES